MTATRQILYVLALLEAGLTILAGLGQAVAMGGLPYAAVGLVEAALFVVAGAAAARGRRYGAVLLIVGEGVRVQGLWLSAIASLLPYVDLPVTVSTLLGGALLPHAVMALAARSLAGAPAPAPTGPEPAGPGPAPEPEATAVLAGAAR